MKRSITFYISAATRQTLLWITYISTNWWPENIITCKIRGFFVGKFFRKCGKNFQIGRNFRILHPQNIEVGNDVYIAQDSWINAKGGIRLGDSVVIGPRCGLITTFHKKIEGRGYAHKIGAGECAPIKIDNGTWLAINAVVRHNITIGKYCVIAANAVVTKNVPDNTTVGGVPAKTLKQN